MNESLPEASISGAATLWCNFHLDRSARATIRLRKTVFALIDESEYIENIKTKEIDECKDSLLRFASVAEEQLECVQSLEGGDAMNEGLDFTTPVLKGALPVILSTASSTERATGRLEMRVADLQPKYDAYQQDKIDHRLNVLTIISAIFLPLSLLTRFWGMNWEEGMPLRTRRNDRSRICPPLWVLPRRLDGSLIFARKYVFVYLPLVTHHPVSQNL